MSSGSRTRRRPSGHVTRGKTAFNRLRQVDVYVAQTLDSALSSGTPLIVDIGYGAYPWTTLEMRDRLCRVNPRVRVVGVEIDPERVALAQPYAEPPLIDFRLGGFNLEAALNGERATLIRCYNVLRQYDESAVAPALVEMSPALAEGGYLIEGTSTPSGRLVAFDVYSKRGEDLRHEALVFGTNFRASVEAVDFQAILPKRLIHHMLDPLPAAFFADWQRAFVQRRTPDAVRWRVRRAIWIAALTSLRERYSIAARFGLMRRGYLVLRDTLGCNVL